MVNDKRRANGRLVRSHQRRGGGWRNREAFTYLLLTPEGRQRRVEYLNGYWSKLYTYLQAERER